MTGNIAVVGNGGVVCCVTIYIYIYIRTAFFLLFFVFVFHILLFSVFCAQLP